MIKNVLSLFQEKRKPSTPMDYIKANPTVIPITLGVLYTLPTIIAYGPWIIIGYGVYQQKDNIVQGIHIVREVWALWKR